MAFLRCIKATGVSVGRQAKYMNMLRTSSSLRRAQWRKTKRRDIKYPIARLADRSRHQVSVNERTRERKNATLAR